MERAENAGNGGCLQRDSTECKEYAGAQSTARPETGETEVREPKLLEKILFRDNMNRAYKRVKANKGAPGVDGMTVSRWKLLSGITCFKKILSRIFFSTNSPVSSTDFLTSKNYPEKIMREVLRCKAFLRLFGIIFLSG